MHETSNSIMRQRHRENASGWEKIITFGEIEFDEAQTVAVEELLQLIILSKWKVASSQTKLRINSKGFLEVCHPVLPSLRSACK